jgi:hypothetical protein
MNVRIALPSVHIAGQDGHYEAHLEIGPHGLALFLSPDAEYPILDINTTTDDLDAIVHGLEGAVADQRASAARRAVRATVRSTLTPDECGR